MVIPGKSKVLSVHAVSAHVCMRVFVRVFVCVCVGGGGGGGMPIDFLL